MYVGIKEGKIFDVVSDLNHKRDPNDLSVYYVEVEKGDYWIEDSWDSKNNTNLEDSPLRNYEKEKTEIELKIEELETRITALESKINSLSKF